MNVERFLPLTPVVLEIALSLAAGERHGYEIMQDVERRTDGAIALHPGTLYRALGRLLDQGLIEELDERPAGGDGRRAAALLPADAARPGGRARRSRTARQPGHAPRAGCSAEGAREHRRAGLPRPALRLPGRVQGPVRRRRCSRRSAIAIAPPRREGRAARRAPPRPHRSPTSPSTPPPFASSKERELPMNWQSLADGRPLRAAGCSCAIRCSRCWRSAALTLGIGANTAIFTIVNGVLLKPLPYADPGRLVMVWSTNAIEHRDREVVAPLDFLDYRKAGAFADLQATYSFLVGARADEPRRRGADPRERRHAGHVRDAGPRAGARPHVHASRGGHRRGRQQPASGARGSAATRTCVGRVLNIARPAADRSSASCRPTSCSPTRRCSDRAASADRPTSRPGCRCSSSTATAAQTGHVALTRDARFLSVVGRLKPGVTAAQADAEIAGIARQLAATYPTSNRVVGATVVPLHEQAVGGTRPALLLLLGGVGFVLLMACVNLANLLLARSSVRQREMAIRSALGAARRRLIMQTMVETMLLSLAGGILALVAVNWAIGALIALAPADLPRLGEIRPDAWVLGFTFALSLVTGLAIGLVPALAASRPAVQSTLKESGRGATSGRGQRRLRNALVVAEVALAVVLTLGRRPAAAQLPVGALDRSRLQARPPADAADRAAQQLPDARPAARACMRRSSAVSTRCRASRARAARRGCRSAART